ncbi:MAG: flagellar basal-body rod protein FlgG [Lachnospiraceae bacterium]|nr:flagellar basal-body rod protein FlgG [Lachnospiraceae bacterium]
MVRSLWTAATGMKAQQTNLDNISNNLANVNTLGYKTKKAEFKSLLYQTLQTKSTNNAGDDKPVPAQVGLGTRVADISTSFTQGPLKASESPYNMAIEGEGFYKIRMADGTIGYTRDGDFTVSPEADGNMLVTPDGYAVLDQNNNPIVIPNTYRSYTLSVDAEDGSLHLTDDEGKDVRLAAVNEAGETIYEVCIGLVQFNNPDGLDALGGNLFGVTPASGEPMEESTTQGLTRSKVHQFYLEGSNVQVVDEMVNMIVAQRAYEMNSKIITASDEMMQQANNLRG